jgi:tetratricopeptide (TPR) repeat protein
MKKNLLIILLVGLGISTLLFSLPKGNVAGKTQNTPAGGANRDAGSEKTEKVAEKEEHAAPLSSAQLKEISTLKSAFAAAKTDASQVKALENLMRTFMNASHYDSAAVFAANYADQHPSLTNVLRAGQLYFEAQTYALNGQKGGKMGEKARLYFTKALAIDPSNLLVKSNMAMTYVDTPTPMKGITLLREVIEQEPTFVPALFNLGILSIKSNQFGKGQERFTQILKLEPNNHKAALNLGFCLAQLDKKEEAEKVLKRVLEQSKDAEEQKAAKELLAEMQEH